MDAPKLSPLDAEHRALGARMGAFAGWDMPISYAGTVAEHTAVRTDCGVFDVSHLGKIVVRGAAAREVLDRALTNAMTSLEPGRARYTLMLDENDGIVDDMIVYALAEDMLVVPNAANVDEVERRLKATPGADACEITQTGDAIVAVQGPRSTEIVERVAGAPSLAYMHVAETGDGVVVSRSGYTGEVGYELFVPPPRAAAIWRAVLDEGAVPCGLAARDTLRLEMGYPLHGNDIDTTTTPPEAGLLWAVKKADRDAFAPPRKTLVGIRMEDRVIPRAHAAVLAGDRPVGECTSGTFSPTLKTGIAMAYVEPGSLATGDRATIEVRGKRGEGVVCDPPFVPSSPK